MSELQPQTDAQDNANLSVQAIIANQISNYTNRPDLLLKALEEYSPGAVKEIHELTVKNIKEQQQARFIFGVRRAYTSLVLQAVAAVASLGLAFFSVFKGVGFWGILGAAILYAVTQGGITGFGKIIDAVSTAIGKRKE